MPEKLIIALDSQGLGSLDCLYRYDMRFGKNIDIAETSDSIKKGSFFHELLRYYYEGKEGILSGSQPYEEPKTPYQARDNAVVLARRKIPDIGINQDLATEVLATFHEYVDHYAGETWKAAHVESPFSVILFEDPNFIACIDGIDYEGLVILWEGIIDLEVQNDFEYFPVDHKTASRRNYPEVLNNQFMGYAFAKQSRIICVNQIEFKKSPDKFHRVFLSYPDYLVDQWVESVIDAVYDKLIPAVKKNKWPRNHHACNQKFKCVFHDYCENDETTRKFLLQTKYTVTKPWDPFSRDE
jgi:hypothetical protein